MNEYPNLAAFLSQHVMEPGYDYEDEFERGLDIILDGLATMLPSAGPAVGGAEAEGLSRSPGGPPTGR